MKMNILVLTSEYPGNFQDPNNNITPVVHYFAKEWVSLGHNVIVIHNAHKFPAFVHALPKYIKEKFLLYNGFSIMGLDYIKADNYILDNVPVWRLPINKYIPHGDHTSSSIEIQYNRICNILSERHFKPDVVIGHWTSPQIQLLQKFKYKFNCNTALTLHDLVYLKGNRFNFKKYLDGIDKLGFRNKSEAKKGLELINNCKPFFICHSGIPEDLLKSLDTSFDKFYQDKLFKLIFVGRLIKRKHIDVILNSLHKSNINNFQLDIVGTGPQMKELIEQSRALNIDDKVIFHGRLERGNISDLYKSAHLFVMISHDEPFGLVYLEAMAARCITIASIGEGMDGIIENGKNGFLCDSGNEENLIFILNNIYDLSVEKKINIASEGRRTAELMSDKNVAINYLNSVMANSINYEL